MDEYGYLSSLT